MKFFKKLVCKIADHNIDFVWTFGDDEDVNAKSYIDHVFCKRCNISWHWEE